MLFTEFRFLPFFVLVFAVHWLLRGDRQRKAWLLLASYLFYAAWDWRFLTLILGSTLLDYTVGLRLERESRPSSRRRWLLLSLVGNLGALGFFKYFDFFIGSAGELLSWLGFRADLPTLRVILPVGISFYTFQTLSYSIDVYRRRLQPTHDLLDLAFFVGFFPQLVAGPIVRAADFLPQLREARQLQRVDFRPALLLFLSGFVKKACISDNIAPIVDQYFASPEAYDLASTWAGVLLYAVQIYCDFSGYSDMAIACAALLGYTLPVNFRHPYMAVDITDFWRRWHVSLSTWLRDYLYIPLGGNRGSTLFTYRNLMATMLLGGLWHGAAWHFVAWGGLHGLALIVHREWRRLTEPFARLRRLARGLAVPITLYWVCLCWIFFRAEDFSRAWQIARCWVLLAPAGPRLLPEAQTALLLMPILLLAHWFAFRGFLRERWQRVPAWAFSAGFGAVLALALRFVQLNNQPFIYFQF